MKKILTILLLVMSVVSKSQINDSINFEALYPYSNNWVMAVDSMDGNWQVGMPNKSVFNSANSGENVLITDTANAYSINQDSYVYL